MPRRPYGSDEDLNLLRMALMEQNSSAMPGRVPSGIAHNAYLSSIPRTFEQEREGDVLGEMDRRYFANREGDRARQSKVDDVEALATMRNFETRGGVHDADIPKIQPKAFTAANFGPVSSHSPMREPEPEPETPVRTIRRFKTSDTPIDPDAAMGARERARLDPRVMTAETQAAGDLAIAKTRSQPASSGGGASPFAVTNARRTISAIEDVLGTPQPDGTFKNGRINMLTAGPIGSLASNIPGTEAANVDADLSSISANVAFKALQDMRDASKTGGALGNVANRELDLLSAVEGSIRQNQSPENLRRNLQKIHESQQRFLRAAESGDEPSSSPRGGSRRQVGRFTIEE